ncbi:hypothetical protein GGI12_004061 [Dipsacomyces acuminosporus]|nr:hypothetical protein GGI12_004061 [Dipsacomyces acuminosporus]
MYRTIAESIPDDCLRSIFEYLWDDSLIRGFFSRRSRQSSSYDQRYVHSILRSRSIAPLHVCRSWRICAVPQFFRYAMVAIPRNASVPLPPSGSLFVDKLFLQIGDGLGATYSQASELVGSLEKSVPFSLPSARTAGLCFMSGSKQDAYHSCSRDSDSGELVSVLESKLPQLQHLWLQSTGHISQQAAALVRSLVLLRSNQQRPQPCVRAIHLPFVSRENPAAVDVICMSAPTLEFLCLGQVSGGVLGDLLYMPSGNSGNSGNNGNNGNNGNPNPAHEQVLYPRLRRLLFSVEAKANIYASLPNYTQTPFPSLEELYFDEALSNGLPLEEWYAPLYDIFLKHVNPELRYLSFPIVYNTQRMVSQRNCPKLMDLRHVKCCWATGVWSTMQADSDSTRVLKAVATIPTLKSYVHPSYITRLSSLPTEISCLQLTHLDLNGWPLTLHDITWILAAFSKLTTLRVTAANSLTTTETAEALFALRSGCSIDEIAQRLNMSAACDLTIGAVNAGLEDWELPHLVQILANLPKLETLLLYSRAYAYVKSALESTVENGQYRVDGCKCGSPPRGRLANAKIANLDGHELAGQMSSSSPRTSPVLAASTIAEPPSPVVQPARNCWQLISRLIVSD